MWVLTGILMCVIIIFLYWNTWRNDYWKQLDIPHIESFPIVGSMLNVVLSGKTFAESICDLYTRLDGYKYGGYMQFTKPVLILRDPELINQVMVKSFSCFHDRGLPMNEEIEPLSANLLNLGGKRWRQIRYRLIPAFTSSKLKTMFDQITRCCEDAVQFLADKKESIEVKEYMQKFNLNVIGLVAFGLNVDALNANKKSNSFVSQSIKLFAPSMKILLNFLIIMSSPRLGKLLKLKTMDPEVTNFFVNLVRDTVNYREATNTKRNDFIQLMLDLKYQEMNNLKEINNQIKKDEWLLYDDEHKEDGCKEDSTQPQTNELQDDSQVPVFTDMCITAQSFFFISGGSETTATVLSFALYELAVNLDVQSQVQREVDSVLSSQSFTYQAINELIYLEQVINEVMRLHPPAGVLSRICTKDFLLPGTDKIIKKGVLINIPILGLHKNPEYFSDPETFDPTRFSDMKTIPKGVYLPFGNGPRICIAKRLAMLEMKIFIAKLISKYNFTLSQRTQSPMKMAVNAIIPNVVGGIWITFKQRE